MASRVDDQTLMQMARRLTRHMHVCDDDWDGHEVGAASRDLAEHGQIFTQSYSLAKALADAHPQCGIEGQPGQWYRVYVRRESKNPGGEGRGSVER